MIKSGRVLPTITAISVGLLVLLDLFVTHQSAAPSQIKQVTSNISGLLVNWVAIVASFALLLGFANVISVHWHRIRSQKPGTIYSAVLLISLIITLVIGLSFGPNSTQSQFIFKYVLQPLEATFFSLLAVFIVTAAYRAFRIRNLETFFFVLFAVIVLLGQVPLGIYLWAEFPIIKDWILNVPTLAGVRGILLGVALGTIATGLRVLMAADRPYMD